MLSASALGTLWDGLRCTSNLCLASSLSQCALKVVAVSVPQRKGPPQSGAGLAAHCKACAAEHALKLCAQIKGAIVMAQCAMAVDSHRNVPHKCDTNRTRIVFCGEEI